MRTRIDTYHSLSLRRKEFPLFGIGFVKGGWTTVRPTSTTTWTSPTDSRTEPTRTGSKSLRKPSPPVFDTACRILVTL